MGETVRPGPGEIVSLVALLQEHSGAVEADLARFYPAEDLRDLFRPDGRLTWRRLDVLVQHLPLESATQTARLALMTDADFAATAAGKHAHGPWSHADLLLASVVDAVNRLIYVQMRRAGDTTAPLPEPLPRPGLRAGNVRAINQKAVAYLNNLRARGA